jgi:hypothetical protein
VRPQECAPRLPVALWRWRQASPDENVAHGGRGLTGPLRHLIGFLHAHGSAQALAGGSSVAVSGSAGGPGGYDPLARLTGHRRDAVEVGVVVKHGEAAFFGRGSGEEIRHLVAALMLGRQEPLDPSRSALVVASRLKQLEDLAAPPSIGPTRRRFTPSIQSRGRYAGRACGLAGGQAAEWFSACMRGALGEMRPIS